jgi:hypothetical protein
MTWFSGNFTKGKHCDMMAESCTVEQTPNNRGILGSNAVCSVHAKAIQKGPTGKVR